jgi:DNA polymerase-4
MTNKDPEETIIAHVDMDAFFARVEKRDYPSLREQPVVVGGLGPRGVVSTACYRARERGIHSALPMNEARQRCPEAEFLSPRTDRYREISEKIHDLFNQITPYVKPLSLDEAYLDVTGVLHHYNSRKTLAKSIRRRIREQTGLTASVGVGPNTMIAKLASDQSKPDNLIVVFPDDRRSFLRPLPVGALPGIGSSQLETLEDEGIETIGDLQERSAEELKDTFGSRGLVYDRKSRGHGNQILNLNEETKSISHEETYPSDHYKEDELLDRLHHLTGKTARRLRKKDLSARTIFIKIRRGDFTTLTRQRTVHDPLASTESIWEEVREIFRRDVSVDYRGIRLQGVGLSNLRSRYAQRELFKDDPKNRRSDLNDVADEINESMGAGSLFRGRSLRNDPSDSES